ncbi:MAG: hypothetical protein AAF192_01805 [Pseudomonadota bacterium]
MPLDALRPFDGAPLPATAAQAHAAARAAELALSRRLAPGEAWAEAGLPDLAFDAAREAFRAAHARAAELADEEAWEEDPDAWDDEPFED